MCANTSNWKGSEREVAKAFDTTRAPVCNNLTHSDTFHLSCYIEVKKRKRFWIWGLFEDTKKKALAEKKIPIVAIKQKGKKGFLILLRPEDIKEVSKCITIK